MTSVLREVPSQLFYLVFSSTEEGEREKHEEPPLKVVRYANEYQQPQLPKSLCRFIKTLLSSTHCENTIRCHNPGNFFETEDFCSNSTGEHDHIFFYSKSFVGTENFIKESISGYITRAKPPSKFGTALSLVYSIVFRELFEERQVMEATDSSYMASVLQRSSYLEFDDNEEIEKVSNLCRELA